MLEVVDVSSLNVARQDNHERFASLAALYPRFAAAAYAASAPSSSMPSVDHFEPVQSGAQRYRRAVVPEPSELA
jgi:hypothetical protein